MMADNLSKVGVACTAIGANTAAEQHISVRRLPNDVVAGSGSVDIDITFTNDRVVHLLWKLDAFCCSCSYY